MDKKKIGLFICELRNAKKWTQEELANKLYVDRTVVSKWERGLYIPGTEELLKMQELFGVTINEILYGEKKSKNNNEKVDSLPVKIIEEETRKTKKNKITFIVAFLVLLIGFLFYYFISNYNSIKVYTISGESSNFIVSNGFLFTSNSKSYIRLGKIENKSIKTDEIKKVRFYYIKDKKEITIIEGDIFDLNKMFVNEFNYNELYARSDLKYIISNSKIELSFDNYKEIIDLNIVKDFSNDKMIEKYKAPISTDEELIINNNIPSYIKKLFKYDSKNDFYERITDNVTELFFPNEKVYTIIVKSQDNEERYSYYINSKTLEHQVFTSKSVIDSYSYRIEDNKCLFGNCNQESIKYIKNNYIDKLI